MQNINISSTASIEDIQSIFGNSIPEYHPEPFWQSRLFDKTVLVATRNEAPIGFLVYNIWWGNCPFIELIKIKPEFQRQGVGNALLGQAKLLLKEKGFATAISSTELSNPLGLQFHEKEDFKKLNILALPHGGEQFYTITL